MVIVEELEAWEQEAAMFCFQAHGGQLDKAGRPYYLHPWRVAQMVKEMGGVQAQIITAYLHDTIEDTKVCGLDIRLRWGDGIGNQVEALTHRENEPRADYLARVIAQPGCALVKYCDIMDNLAPERVGKIDRPTRRRLVGKYGEDLKTLAVAL